MKGFKTSLLFLVVLSAFAIILTGCGGGGGGGTTPTPSTVTRQYIGTQTPGDFWTRTMTESNGTKTFSSENVTQNKTYSGNWSELTGNSSGFLKLNVTNTTDTNITPPVTAYAIEVPDTVLIAAPGPFTQLDHGDGWTQLGTNNPPVLAIAKSSCPTSGGNFIWINMPGSTWKSYQDNAYGTATLTVSNGNYNVAVDTFKLDGTSDVSFTLSGCSCSDGVISCQSQEEGLVRTSFTPSGVFFVDTANNGVVGFALSDSNIDLTDLVANGRTLKGFYFNSLYGYGTWSVPETDPMYAVADGSKFTPVIFTDIEQGETMTMTGTYFQPTTQPMPGLIRGTLHDADGDHDAVMAVRKINGKFFVFGISDNWPSMHGHNFLMLEK